MPEFWMVGTGAVWEIWVVGGEVKCAALMEVGIGFEGGMLP